MLRVVPFLGLVLGLTACGTTAHFTDLSEESTQHRFPFPRSQVAAQSFEPTTRRTLSAQGASVLAAQLANERCEHQYRRRPFKPEHYPAVLQDSVYHWGKLDIGGPGRFSALVTFNRDGSEPHVEVYFSSDTL
jgi:hypothetical protein